MKYHRSESFIHFTYFEAISLVKTKKNRGRGGGGLSPLGKNENRNHFVFFSFGVDPLNWQSFIEIGEMACSTTARCSCGHTLNVRSSSVSTFFLSATLHTFKTPFVNSLQQFHLFPTISNVYLSSQGNKVEKSDMV